MKRIAMLSLILSLSSFGMIPAQTDAMDMPGMDMGSADAVTAAVGVVKQVDQAKGVVVITHEPIKSLGWSAMTMNFMVENKQLFARLVQDRKIHFEFIVRGSEYVITSVK